MRIENRPDAALAKLLAEMQALMWILPTKAMPAPGPFGGPMPQRDRPLHQAAREAEARIEAGFDNMPV